MKDIKAIKGRHYIHHLIEEGEHEHQDFKFAISDARKIARSISAFANNDGGRLLIGVKDNGAVAGIRNEEDIYMIETASQSFCRPAVEVEMTAFKVDPGVVVLRASIPKVSTPPVSVVESGGILKAYYRIKDENMVAPDVLLRAWEIRTRDGGTLLHLDDAHRSLLSLIESHGGVTVDDFARHSHLSRQMALDIAARMLASEVIRIGYGAGDFLLGY